MTNMKIVYLITKSNWGGAQKYVYELATGVLQQNNLNNNSQSPEGRDLNALKYEVKVIVGGNGPLVEKLKSAGIEVISIDSLSNVVGFKKEIQTLADLWKIIRKEKPDVLHVNSSKAGIIGALIGRILRVPKIIFTAHGWAFNEDRPFWQKIILKILHWFTLVLAHQTIAVSENIKNSFNGWPLLTGKITVIHNGIKSGTSYSRNGARQELLNKFPQLKKSLENKHLFWIGTIAELHPVKNLDQALIAIRELIDINNKQSIHSKQTNINKAQFLYTIIGEGNQRVHLEKIISDLKLSEHVLLFGHIPDAFQYIKAFDTFLLPSRSEALAYVILEAGLQETPVIATAVGGIPEIISDMTSGILIQPNKPTEIAHALDFYAEHHDVAKQYAKTLNEKVKKDFTLARMLEETEKIYK